VLAKIVLGILAKILKIGKQKNASRPFALQLVRALKMSRNPKR
jgi:hypothetical protein